MFQLSRSGEYAIRAMVYLAVRNTNDTISIAEISKAEETPETFLRKIVQQLIRAKLLRSVRGVRGGIALARTPLQITMLDIIEAVEGPIFLNKCLIGPNECERWTWCPVHNVWGDAQEKLLGVLRAKTLIVLANEREAFYANFISNKQLPHALHVVG